MNRILVVVISALVAASSVAPAEAGSRVSRTVQGSYGPYPAPVTGCNAPAGAFACLTVPVRRGETAFTARVTDRHGRPVFVEVHDDNGITTWFCGRTTAAVPVQAGSTLSFHIGTNNWLPTTHCPLSRVKTTGTLRVTLTGYR